MQLFARHQPTDDAPHTREQEMMLQLNTSVDSSLSHWGMRLAGENGRSTLVDLWSTLSHGQFSHHAGVATGFIHLITPLETW